MQFLIRQKVRVVLVSTIAALLFYISLSMVSSEKLYAVTLLYFRGSGIDDAINLEWATGTELDTAGFYLERSDASTGPFQVLTSIGFIPAEGEGLFGAEYNVIDDYQIVTGERYWYVLVEVEVDSNENRIDPIGVTAGLSNPTQTPSAAPTNPPATSPGNTPESPTPTSISGLTTTSTSISTEPIATATPQSAGTRSTRLADSMTSIPAERQTAESGSPSLDSADQLTDPFSSKQEGTSRASGYPGPNDGISDFSTSIPDTIGTAYPLIEPLQADNTSNSYPLPGSNVFDELNSTPPDREQPSSSFIGLGENAVNDLDQDTEQDSQTMSTVFLWIGFVAALLIFVAGLLGSIMYYTRPVEDRQQGD